MSVQLIVYPQSYGGYFNTISSSPTEVVVNGISFINLGATSEYTSSSATPYVDTITNAPPNSINTWYSYRSDFVGTPAFPTVLAGNLVLNSLGNGSTEPTGIYQKLTNLIIGQQYKLTINIGTQAANGSITNRFFDGLTPQGSVSIFGTATSSITQNFFATNTEMTVMLGYYSTVAEDLTISDISVQPIIGAIPSGSSSILEDGQVICDLYEDEDLPLTLSVDDFKNVAEQVQSYSKAFNLPATKRNNKIFNQIFEITRSYDGVIFNPYKKTKCVLKQDGFVLFQGYLRLLDVTDKLGEVSFNVNLYSEVIALADFLKDRTFSDLDFSELEHFYDYSSIRNTWQGINIFPNPSTSGFRDGKTLKYPFVDWNHQFTVGTAGFPVLPNLESAFRPFINIKYLIDRIFQGTPFSYTSEFFNTSLAGGGAFDFDKLFMDFNWGGDLMPSPTNEYAATWNFGTGATSNIGNGSFKEFRLLPETEAGGEAGSTVPPNYEGNPLATNPYIITATTDNEIYKINYNFRLEATSGLVVAECQWVHTTAAGVVSIINYQSINSILTFSSYVGGLTVYLQTGDTLKAQFKSTAAVRQNETFDSYSWFVQSSIEVNSATLNTLRGETGQWDFIKGLMTMFNLITIPDENNPNNIIIEPYADVFIDNTKGTDLLSRSIQHDWTEKVDVSQMKLEPLADLNKNTIFKFVEDDDDYAFTQYKNSVGGHLYGSKKYNAGNEFNILEGLDEIVAEPFAATVVKPLQSQFFDFIVPSLYSYNANDDTSEGFDNSPRIMYNNGVKLLTSCTYNVPSQNCSSAVSCGDALEDEFLQFSHLTDIPTIVTSPPAVTDTRDFHFGECQLLNGVGNPTAYNLFNMYWLPYYAELYNPDTRIMTIKVNLSPSDINTFKFNDTVFIKNRIFRCNRIDYKPNDLATVEFILIP